MDDNAENRRKGYAGMQMIEVCARSCNFNNCLRGSSRSNGNNGGNSRTNSFNGNNARISSSGGNEPALCKLVDCKTREAQQACPATCGESKEPELCKVVDCSKPEAVSLCPNSCGNKQVSGGNRRYGSSGGNVGG